MRGFRDQETLLAVIAALDEIAEDLAEGLVVKALHGIRDLSAHALDASRNVLADHASLTGFPPLHAINAELHKCRRPLLERRAAEARLLPSWAGDEFTATDESGSAIVEVDAGDNWRLASSSPDWVFADSGLITLMAALRGEPVALAASSVTRWLRVREVSRA